MSAIIGWSLRFTNETLEEAITQRDSLLKAAHNQGILLRPAWKLLHHLPMYINNPHGDLSVAEDQSVRLLNLPSSPQLLK